MEFPTKVLDVPVLHETNLLKIEGFTLGPLFCK